MSNLVKLIIVILLGGLAGFAVLRWLLVLASPPPENLGARDGRLAPCPDSPNCVSTSAAAPDQLMAAIPYSGDTAVARERLLAVLERTPRLTVQTIGDTYIHAEARSLLWGFIDDVEFQFDAAAELIHFRSAARLGHGDMGANRARMAAIQAEMGE